MKNIIGRRIVAAREMRGISAKALAKLLLISPSRLSNWETGVSGVSSDYIYKISEALNVTSDYLIGLSDSPDAIFEGKEEGQRRAHLVTMFSKLNPEGQAKVADYASDLKKTGDYEREAIIPENDVPRTYQHAAHGADLTKLSDEEIGDIEKQVDRRREHLKKLD